VRRPAGATNQDRFAIGVVAGRPRSEMKIGIVSDSHDRADALASAVRDAAAQGASAVIHCGDLIGAHTIHYDWRWPPDCLCISFMETILEIRVRFTLCRG
jgi:hypothetical protein